MNGLWVVIPLLFLWESVGVVLDQFNANSISTNKKSDNVIKYTSYKPSIIYYYMGASLIVLYIVLVPAILSMAPFVPVQL